MWPLCTVRGGLRTLTTFIHYLHAFSSLSCSSYLASSQSIRLFVNRGLCGPVAIFANSMRRFSASLDPTGSGSPGQEVGCTEATCCSASTLSTRAASFCCCSIISFLLDSIFLCRFCGQFCTCARPQVVSCMESVSSFSGDERWSAEGGELLPSHSVAKRKVDKHSGSWGFMFDVFTFPFRSGQDTFLSFASKSWTDLPSSKLQVFSIRSCVSVSHFNPHCFSDYASDSSGWLLVRITDWMLRFFPLLSVLFVSWSCFLFFF